MELNVIKAKVENRRIAVEGHIEPTAGNRLHDAIEITLDDAWEGLEKRVTFYRDDVAVTQAWDGTSNVIVPWEVLTEPGSFGFTVVGSENGEDRLVTYALRPGEEVQVRLNGDDEGVDPSPATPDLLHRMEQIAEEMEAGEEGRESRFEAFIDQAGANVQGAVNNANTAATAADRATASANNAAGTANTAANNANKAESDLREAAQRGDFDGERGDPGYSGVYVGLSTDTPPDNANVRINTDGDGTPVVRDVQINGESKVVNGVVNIPIAGYGTLGAVMVNPAGNLGLNINANGYIMTQHASSSDINNRSEVRKVLSPYNLDYAVTASLTDGKSPAWTDTQKLAARERLGLGNYKHERVEFSETVAVFNFIKDYPLRDIIIGSYMPAYSSMVSFQMKRVINASGTISNYGRIIGSRNVNTEVSYTRLEAHMDGGLYSAIAGTTTTSVYPQSGTSPTINPAIIHGQQDVGDLYGVSINSASGSDVCMIAGGYLDIWYR